MRDLSKPSDGALKRLVLAQGRKLQRVINPVFSGGGVCGILECSERGNGLGRPVVRRGRDWTGWTERNEL